MNQKNQYTAKFFFSWMSMIIFIGMYIVEIKAENNACIPLKSVAQSYTDKSNHWSIDSVMAHRSQFYKVNHFNFGVSWYKHWLRFELNNDGNVPIERYIGLESVVCDYLTLYTVHEGKVIAISKLGEGTPLETRSMPNLKPVFKVVLPPNEHYEYFLNGEAIGQPICLDGKIMDQLSYESWNETKHFFNGTIYGVLFLILLLNLSFFLTTGEKLYIIFTLQLIFAWACLLQFDGFISKYLFPNNLYWINESIAIFLSLTFVLSNMKIATYYNLAQMAPMADKVFQVLTISILCILSVSFFHPIGFSIFIYGMLVITSIVAALLLFSVLLVKQRGFTAYFYGLIATVSLIIFGSWFQLYMGGIIPDTFLSRNAMHFAVTGQSIFMALAINDKLKIIQEESHKYQQSLVNALNDYAQNLTTNIENERQRLAKDLHDSLGQNLLSVRNRLLLMKKKQSTVVDFDAEFDSLNQAISETLDEMRTISYNLRPPILNTLGLTTAIRALVDHMRQMHELAIDLHLPSSIDGKIEKNLEINIYRIIQECFNNVTKHAEANKVVLSIKVDDQLYFKFTDNGMGFDLGAHRAGQGLIGIKERVALLSGKVSIISEKQKGTTIQFNIPITHHHNTNQ